MRSLYKRKEIGRHGYYFGIDKKFKGFGFIMRVNDPYALKEFIVFELRLSFFSAWYSYERNINR